MHIVLCFVLLSSSCVPYVASFSGLWIFDCPFGNLLRLLYPRNEVVGVHWLHHARPSVCLQTNPMSYDNLRCVFWNLLKFHQLFTGEERRIPFIFDDFHFCRSRVIGLDMTENRMFTLCRMITWVAFLKIFWNFISSLPVKRGGSLSFLTIFTFAVPELLDLIWRKIGFLPYVV
jgi:hypothetical protein